MKVVLSSLLEISLGYLVAGQTIFCPPARAPWRACWQATTTVIISKVLIFYLLLNCIARSSLNGSWNPSKLFLIITFQWISKSMIC